MFDIDNKNIFDTISLQCDTPAVAGLTLPSDSVEVSLAQRSEAIVHGLRLILTHHKCPKTLIDEMRLQVLQYLNICPDEEVWSKHAKSMLACPLARYLRNELPVAPKFGYLTFHGGIGGWLRERRKVFSRSNTHLWYSWFQGKRSALPASEFLIQKTYDDHLVTLTHLDEGDDIMINQIFQNKDFEDLLVGVRDDFERNLRENPQSDFNTLMPSVNACFEASRSDGGQQVALRELVGLFNSHNFTCGLDEKQGDFIEILECLDEMIYDNELGRRVLYTSPYYKTHRQYENRECWDPTDDLYSMEFETVSYGKITRFNYCREIRFHPFYEWDDLKLKYLLLDNKRTLSACIQGVLEPLKVRVISKGESLPYYSMKPLQKALHSALRAMDCFKLIGRPISPTDLIDLRFKAKFSDEWFSIDYSGATDGLSWKYSSRIFRYLIANLNDHDRAVAMQVLGPHDLYYPDKKGIITKRGKMTTGQLMGSVLSFPLLCLCNMGVYLTVMAEENCFLTYKEKLSAVLINGDDMLYCAPRHLWEKHIEVAAKVGLKMSIGKAYHHRTYANINSVSYHYDLNSVVATPWQIDFLNVGLILGQHKVMESSLPLLSKEGEKPYTSDEALSTLLRKHSMNYDHVPNFVCNINTILNGCLPGRQTAMLKYLIFKHKDDIKRDCATLVNKNSYSNHFYRKNIEMKNLFVAISLGGMGVNAPPGFKFRIKPIHRHIMKAMIEQDTHPFSFGRPCLGYPVTEVSAPLAPWLQPVSSYTLPTNTLNSKKLNGSVDIIRYNPCITERVDSHWRSPWIFLEPLLGY